MKYLKLFESYYDNQELTDSEFQSLLKETLPFTKSELKMLYDYFSQYVWEDISYTNQKKIIDIKGLNWIENMHFSKLEPPLFKVYDISERWVTILKLEDNWYLLFDWAGVHSFTYWKIDDLQGLFSYFDKLDLLRK